MIERLQAENLRGAGIAHGFFTRNGGVSTGVYGALNCGLSGSDDQAAVAENRRLVAVEMGVPTTHLLSCKQTHSPDVITVTAPWAAAARPEADAMVTRERGIALGVLSADCVPILFADPVAGVVGAAHAGWRGAIGGVIENTLKVMEGIGAKRSRIEAAVGPCIWQNSYEVGPEFPAVFLAENPQHQRFFHAAARPDHYLFDLPGYVANKLRGLKVAAVEPSPADTCADPKRFFSYRRNCLEGNKAVGNQISVIALEVQ